MTPRKPLYSHLIGVSEPTRPETQTTKGITLLAASNNTAEQSEKQKRTKKKNLVSDEEFIQGKKKALALCGQEAPMQNNIHQSTKYKLLNSPHHKIIWNFNL